MNRAVGYIRVSTTEQASEGVSLLAQENKIKLYCELHELDLIDIKEDAGISGRYINKRPGIQAVLRMVNQGEVQHLVIFKLDRMCRNLKEACEIADLMLAKSASLHSVSENIDTGSATGKFFFHVLSAMAEWERGIISERTLIRLNQKRKLNQKIGRFFPFGKKTGAKTVTLKGKMVAELAPNEQELMAMKLTKEYREAGLKYTEIANRLSEEGYVSPRSGKPYVKSSILAMLKRQTTALVITLAVLLNQIF